MTKKKNSRRWWLIRIGATLVLLYFLDALAVLAVALVFLSMGQNKAPDWQTAWAVWGVSAPMAVALLVLTFWGALQLARYWRTPEEATK